MKGDWQIATEVPAEAAFARSGLHVCVGCTTTATPPGASNLGSAASNGRCKKCTQRTKSQQPSAGSSRSKSIASGVRLSPAAVARWTANSSATSEISASVTCQPRPASQIAWRPAPPAKSRARPARGGNHLLSRETVRDGASEVCSPREYLLFHLSRSLMSVLRCRRLQSGEGIRSRLQVVRPDRLRGIA